MLTICLVVLAFILLIGIKVYKMMLNKFNKEFYSQPLNQNCKGVIVQLVKERRRKCQEAFRLADQIHRPSLKKRIKQDLIDWGAKTNNPVMPAELLISFVNDMIKLDKENPWSTIAEQSTNEQPTRLKKLKRLMDLCRDTWIENPSIIPVSTRIAIVDTLSDFDYQLIDYEYTKSSKDYHSKLLLDVLETILKRYICFDCELVGLKFCKQGHCLNCAKKLDECTCLDCAQALGYKICTQCGTIKPVTDDKGWWLRCCPRT